MAEGQAPWRILFVITSSNFGGAETGVRELAFRLRKGVFETLVCSLRPGGRMAREVEAGGVQLLSLGMSEAPRFGQLARCAGELARIIDEHRIDLIHSCLYRANVLAGIAARLSRGKPAVVSAQHSLTAPGNSRAAALAVRWTRRLSARVIAVSDAVREVIEGDGVTADRIVVIDNGIDTSRFADLDTRLCRHRLGLSEEGLVVLGVGRLTPVKAFHDLIESIGRLRDSDVVVQLILAGEGPERPRLEQMVRDSDLEEQVSFLGVCRDMETVFGAADIFVLSSLREASPAALLEAMASGCAIVATEVGGVPQIVEHGLTGLLVKAGEPEQLAGELRRLVESGELRRQLGGQAKQAAQSRFGIERMVEQHERLYRAVLTSGLTDAL